MRWRVVWRGQPFATEPSWEHWLASAAAEQMRNLLIITNCLTDCCNFDMSYRSMTTCRHLISTAHRGGPCENSDEELGLSRWRTVCGLRLREPQTMVHLLSCRLLDEACTADDLATVTERAKACAHKWEKIVWRTRKKKFLINEHGGMHFVSR